MNMLPLTGFALEQALASKLRELLASISWLHGWAIEDLGRKSNIPFDLTVSLPLAGGPVALFVECKSVMPPSGFHTLIHRQPPTPPPGGIAVPVLAMPFVSPRLADLCAQYGWGWYDLAGNCHIDAPGALFVDRRGFEPVHSAPRRKANLSTPETGRVIRAFLAPENAGRVWKQRTLREHSGQTKEPPIPEPSLGLVNKVVRDLRDEAFIEALDDGGFRLRDPVKLLFAWRDAYRFDRHERRPCFTLLRGAQLREALYKLEIEAGGFAAYASFSAADFQAPHVRQAKTWVYVHRDYVTRFEALTAAKIVDSGENVVLLIPDDDGVFYSGDGGYVGEQRMPCTNPVQTYVDLFHSGNRGEEAAEALLEQKLKPAWRQVRL